MSIVAIMQLDGLEDSYSDIAEEAARVRAAQCFEEEFCCQPAAARFHPSKALLPINAMRAADSAALLPMHLCAGPPAVCTAPRLSSYQVLERADLTSDWLRCLGSGDLPVQRR